MQPLQNRPDLGEEILSQLYRPLEACYNTCYCKKCCYHCQFCFLKKGLGICYEQSRKRRRTPKKAKANTSSASNNRLIPNRTRHCQPEKAKKETVEKAVATAPGLGR
uniref:Protein Tat n=1 Tax=Simian immunodeficiency virus (isolate K78) TaxID=11736 RepID=TAT_SIVML|nr:RecName: Full=Protein Tat; AltName: Full=Transactivating regulatory protein [Simian immunodeficiency virus (K78 ISOLATE)]